MLPQTMLRVARLSLLNRLVSKAPVDLLSLITDLIVVPNGWTQSVADDLKWLCLSEDFTKRIGQSLPEWIGFMRESPKLFRTRVHKFARCGFANICLTSERKSACDEVTDPTFCCNTCDAKFGTCQQLSLHMFKKHGITNMWRLYVGDFVHCPICLKHFWSRERLLNHIRYRSKICKRNLLIRGPIINEVQAIAIDEAEAAGHVKLMHSGRKRCAAIESVVRLHGPLMPTILDCDIVVSKHHHLGVGHDYY